MKILRIDIISTNSTQRHSFHVDSIFKEREMLQYRLSVMTNRLRFEIPSSDRFPSLSIIFNEQ